ncbi:hypothetical protein TREES_T100009323 [Tupaia chinensis]|uniref:Uncharacterized protein n=1 Tax=Tupaia chinensis TaxID=246437 RepID=L9K2M1_TUPCH|nr:hypothetical protein TREES_T100009323 [Tupaia chinensis]
MSPAPEGRKHWTRKWAGGPGPVRERFGQPRSTFPQTRCETVRAPPLLTSGYRPITPLPPAAAQEGGGPGVPKPCTSQRPGDPARQRPEQHGPAGGSCGHGFLPVRVSASAARS